jgi:glyceraldehyde-3-phosphate dehydrogenase type I
MQNSPTVKKVIMCAPGKDLDGTFVMGINDHEYDPTKHHVISNGSCTTNCLAPISKVLHENWGIEYGTMTTVHAYTLDQRMLDADHSDLRRSRAGAVSIIPTSTGAAKAIGLVIPELAGKLDGYALRVPTSDVSIVDLSVKLKSTPTAEEINAKMKEAAEGPLKGILGYSDEPLVSVDYMGVTNSSTLDAALTKVVGDMVKVVSWYDNETGFSNRVIDLATMVAKKL